MTHKERMDEIEKLNIPSGNPTYRAFNEGDKTYLLTRVRTLTEALELILSCEPTDKNGEYDLINQNQFWKACKALEDES